MRLLLFIGFCLTWFQAISASDVLRLKTSNGTNSDETIILFNASASNGYDAYDSQKMFNNSTSLPEIYTIAGGNQLVINGLKSIATNPVISLGFKTLTSGNFSIYISQITGLLGVSIIIEDNLTHKTQNLSKNPTFTFSSNVCNTTTRFSIYFSTANYDWNGNGNWSETSFWSSGSIPLSGNSAIVKGGELTVSANAKIADLTVKPNSKLTIGKGDTLTIQGNILIESDSTGTGTIVNRGTLLVKGTTTVKQLIHAGRNWYIASPVDSAKSIFIKTTSTNKLWNFDESTFKWMEITDSTTQLKPLQGYVANISIDTTISFVGTINSGIHKINNLSRTGNTNAQRGFHLIGNPYPSCVDWTLAQKTNLESSIWYRTKNKENAYVFDTYNADLGIGTNNNENGAVSEFIPPMQAVWVRVNADDNTGSLSFDNAMQSHPLAGNLLKKEIELDAIRLKISNGLQSDETIIAFNQNAKNGFDTFDSEKMFNTNKNIPQLYSFADSEKVVINGCKTFVNDSTIQLGFKTYKAGAFTLSANEITGLSGVSITIEDKLLNTFETIFENLSYTFFSDSVDNTNRFVIHFKSGVETSSKLEEQTAIKILVKGNSAVINTNFESKKGFVSILNNLGQCIKQSPLTAKQSIIELPSAVGSYFITVTANSYVVTKKIIVE